MLEMQDTVLSLEMHVKSLGQEDPWRRKWQPTPVFLLGKSHGQRSLEGYSPWDHQQLYTAELLSIYTFIFKP